MLVFYNSSTGFTKKSAEWISQELHCEAKSIKKVKTAELASHDTIIYGGWIMGSMIMGLNKIRKMYQGRLIIFGVGSSPTTDENTENIKKQNNLTESPFYYFEGGFDYDKLGFFKKKMLGIVRNSLDKKEEKTDEDKTMLERFGNSCDFSNIESISPLVTFARGN